MLFEIDALFWDDKDPDEDLTYSLYWSSRLAAGEIITGSTWTIPEGVVGTTELGTDTSTTIRVSGGEVGIRYKFVNRVTTNRENTMDQTVYLLISSR